MYTIKDVAKYSGVSVATVSRVLNHSECVKEETKELVNRAIHELQYNPNGLGRSLRRLETKRILVVLSTISNQFYSRVLRGIEDKAREQNYHVLIGTTRDQEEQIADYYKMLQAKEVDGAIFMAVPVKAQKELEKLSKNIPVVCACEPIAKENIPFVGIDDQKASEEAVEYLLDNGVRDLGIICSGQIGDTVYTSSFLRKQGYQAVLRKKHIRIRKEWIFEEGLTYNSGKRAVQKMMSLEKKPQAIFSCSDSGAIGAIHELKQHGIQVPEDIQIIGFDNTAISEVFIPSITTVAQPQYKIGYYAMELLMQRICGKKVRQQMILNHEIVVRESTRKT